jgi:acyl phosphate:glycerol-3-phosphate acyltransferase
MIMSFIMIIIAYLIGSVSTAIIICKTLNLPDPRTEGSKNAGASNVVRLAGKKVGAMVMAGDGVKGLIAVMLAHFVGVGPFAIGLVAFAAVVGHVFPLYFNFEGGKGVATAIGSLFGISLILGIIAVIVWFAMVKTYEMASMASLAAIGSAIILSLLFAPGAFVGLLLIGGLVAFKHKDNIDRIRAGTEAKIKF